MFMSFTGHTHKDSNSAALGQVSLLSAVAFNVLSTLHQIPIVLAGVHGSAWRRLGVSLLTVETGFQ